MNNFKKNIIKYKGDKTVIRNMLLAAAMHDISHKTNCFNELENWIINKGYNI